MTPLQKLPKNVGYLGKLIATKGFKKLPKVQKITQSGRAGTETFSQVEESYLAKMLNGSKCILGF